MDDLDFNKKKIVSTHVLNIVISGCTIWSTNWSDIHIKGLHGQLGNTSIQHNICPLYLSVVAIKFKADSYSLVKTLA